MRCAAVARRYRNPLTVVSNIEGVLLLAGLGIGGYLLYQVYKGAKAVGTAAAAAGTAVYHGAQVVTAPVSNAIAAGILKLTQQPAMNVPGNVVFPDGTLAPLSTYSSVYSDSAGNVYIKDRGSTWQLHPSDADGDWPATYVSG
jgi:hypothetical protein